MLKAYKVTNWDEECATVAFAVSNAPARRIGANELDSEWEFVTCQRAPEFDQYAALGRVPMLALLEAGWWQTCTHCQRRVGVDQMDASLDDWADADYIPDFAPINITLKGDDVYCSPHCAALHQAEQMAWAAKRHYAEQQAAVAFPGLRLVECLLGPTLEYKTWVVLQMPHLPGWEGRVGWEVDDADWIQLNQGRAEQAYALYKRMRHQLPFSLPQEPTHD